MSKEDAKIETEDVLFEEKIYQVEDNDYYTIDDDNALTYKTLDITKDCPTISYVDDLEI